MAVFLILSPGRALVPTGTINKVYTVSMDGTAQRPFEDLRPRDSWRQSHA
jgi:hypothetical protein